MMKSIFCDFLYLTLLYRYRASDFQFPFGPSTSVLRDLKSFRAFCDFRVILILHS